MRRVEMVMLKMNSREMQAANTKAHKETGGTARAPDEREKARVKDRNASRVESGEASRVNGREES